MKFSKQARPLFLLILIFSLSNSALAITFSCKKFGNTYSTTLSGVSSGGYNVIKSSCGNLINQHWRNFGMEKAYWDDGWGFFNACSSNTPLNRTFRALELLRSSKDPKFGNALLNTAYDLSKNWISHLRMDCALNEGNTAAAAHFSRSGRVHLYLNTFGRSIVENSSRILHEARHRLKGHNGGTGCPRKASCDTHYQFYGANTYQLLYSWWYGLHGKNSTRFTRQLGLDDARRVQDRAFNVRPNLNIPKRAS